MTDNTLRDQRINRDLLLKTLDHIETLEAFRQEGIATDQWRQTRWLANAMQWRVVGAQRKDTEATCGTAACFAGWACLLNGDQVLGDLDASPGAHSWVRDEGGRRRRVDARARRLLGLTDDEAHELFEACNTLDDIRNIVRELTS